MNSGYHPTEFFTHLYKTIASGNVWSGEICNRAKDGGLYWVMTTIVPFLDNNGKPTKYIAMRSDITELKKASRHLNDALHEKEVLLKEVYHRVKNNLQVVSSLINLQAKTVNNKEAVDLLKLSANRIKSMALIHEKLYQSKDLARIDFKEYTQGLVDHLLFGYGVHPGRIKVKLSIDNIFLDVETAIPCGLIINELISNALKHAFPNDRPGEINITFTHDQDVLILVISDNGFGFSEDVDFKKSKSLGLQLVNTLIHQLMGQITLDKSADSSFTLKFCHAS